MQIELSDKMQDALQKAAAAAGMSVSSYANLLMEEQLSSGAQTTAERARAVDALIEHLRSSTSSSGRHGRRWRDFIHEGHAE
jgi:hypothetical protein